MPASRKEEAMLQNMMTIALVVAESTHRIAVVVVVAVTADTASARATEEVGEDNVGDMTVVAVLVDVAAAAVAWSTQPAHPCLQTCMLVRRDRPLVETGQDQVPLSQGYVRRFVR